MREAHSHHTVVINSVYLINHIATLALAVPPLPEILQMPPPIGFRRAARLAASRIKTAPRDIHADNVSSSTVSKCVPSTNLEATEFEGTIEPDVIQNVVDDSGEPLAVISQAKATDTQRSFWEAATDMCLKRRLLFEISHKA